MRTGVGKTILRGWGQGQGRNEVSVRSQGLPPGGVFLQCVVKGCLHPLQDGGALFQSGRIQEQLHQKTPPPQLPV